MTAITLPLWVYLLAISGIGNVDASFTSRPFEQKVPIMLDDKEMFAVFSSGGVGGQLIDSREISFGENTNRADVWWYPPLQNYLCGDTGCRIHLKTLIDDPERS